MAHSSIVRYVGSRELHRELPNILENLENPDARYVLTIHSKPKAVLLGTDAFLALLRGHAPSDRLLALQLGALVQGMESASHTSDRETETEAENENAVAEVILASELVAVGV